MGSDELILIHLYPCPLVGWSWYQWFWNFSFKMADKELENSTTFSLERLPLCRIKRVINKTAAPISSLMFTVSQVVHFHWIHGQISNEIALVFLVLVQSCRQVESRPRFQSKYLSKNSQWNWMRIFPVLLSASRSCFIYIWDYSFTFYMSFVLL